MMLVVVVVLVLFVLFIFKSTRKPSRFPPGPPRLPLIGSLPYIAIRKKPSDPPSLLTGILKGIFYKNFQIRSQK